MTPGQALLRAHLPTKRGHKYHAEPTTYNGVRYPSRLEADCAAMLDLLQRAGLIASWTRQVPVVLQDGPRDKRITLVLDFAVVRPDGSTVWVEAKGQPTAAWKIKERMFRRQHPDRVLYVVHAPHEVARVLAA